MKILSSILGNALILYLITFLLAGNPERAISDGVLLGCSNCDYTSLEALKTYVLGGIVLGIINITIRPILRILSLPFFFLFFGLLSLVINGVILYLFSYILNEILIIPGVGYTIVGTINFIIAVAIFTFFNTLFSFLLFKR
ncbi:phage holin family protein [Candidatus Gracilibacteria bacterium]|nr:phage holin family protein [Candidatus Gracilibacteria bacterium]